MESIKEHQHWVKIMELGALSGCHQRSDRSFFICGYQFPVCARCTGVFIGEIVTYIFSLFRYSISCMSAICLLLIMGLDWFIQYIDLYQSTNKRRFVTGIMGGIGVTTIYIKTLSKIISSLRKSK